MHVGLVEDIAVAQRDVLVVEVELVHSVHVGLRVLQVDHVGIQLLGPKRDGKRLDVRGVHTPEMQALVRRLARMQRIDRCLNCKATSKFIVQDNNIVDALLN